MGEKDSDSGRVGGVDGVSGGWVMAVTGVNPGSPVEAMGVWRSFGELWIAARQIGLLAVTVDIPIGLPCRGSRSCDQEARLRLKGCPGPPKHPGRASSVFPAPPRCALEAREWEEALALARGCTGKGITKQSFALFPKIREVRDALGPSDFRPSGRPRAAEVHPEVSFQEMAGCPMWFHKSRQAGVTERLEQLEAHFPNVVDATVRTKRVGPPHPGVDDLLDAVAAAWTARRLISGDAKPLGGHQTDQTGFEMSIWV